MKRTIKFLFSVILLISVLTSTISTVSASVSTSGNSTNYTYTIASDGTWMRSQDAYLPGKITFIDSPLNSPDDIFVKDGLMYIAESGASDVVVYNTFSGEKTVIGNGILKTPTGIFVDGNKQIYVADGGLEQIVVFNINGEKIKEYKRPQSNLYGKNAAFKPLKVSVDAAGIISAVCEGSYDGIVQLDSNGEFLGFFGYNTVPVTFTEIIEDTFFTEAQKQKLFNKIPLTFYNLAEDKQGIIYTITQNSLGYAVKKHNVSGSNIISAQMKDEADFVDICVLDNGGIVAVTEKGLVFEYDNDGNLLFTFGGYAISGERNGLITVASGIAADSDGLLYVLDKERGLVHSYIPTAFAVSLHSAIDLYKNGSYAESRDKLNDLLMLSGNISVIYEYLGKNESQLKNYKFAADYYKKAGDSVGYSDVFWEIRNSTIGKYLAFFVVAVIFLIILIIVIKHIFGSSEKLCNLLNKPVFKNLFYGFKMLRHPFDTCYEIKVGRRGNIITSSVIYILALAAFTVQYLFSGFSFNSRSLANTSLLFTVLLFVLPVGLFIICNFFVIEINDGKGTFKKFYIAISYAVTPIIIFLPVATILTHILTLSESFLVVICLILAYLWSAILAFICIKEIHEYEFGQVFLNIVLTLFLMIVVVFAVSVVYMFWDKVVEVFSSIFREVIYRVGK